jgi:general secretion pathway protein A
VVKRIYRATRGIPRLINVLCDRLLLGSYGQNQSQVGAKMVSQAIREVMGEDSLAKDNGARWPWVAGLTALVIAVLLLGVATWRLLPAQAPKAASQPNVAPPQVSEPPVLDRQIGSAGLIQNRREAQIILAGFLGLELPAGSDACSALRPMGWRCENLNAASWDDLLEFDRPVVLTLVSPARFMSYGVLVAVEGQSGVLLAPDGRHTVSLAELGPLWRGGFQLLWQPPGVYNGPVGRGDRGPMVAWLAQAFADLDGQARPLAQDEFNAALEARVKLFQRQFKLRDDGVVGLKTLLRLNAVRGDGMPLRRDNAEFASLGER